jgi:energy-coupling factor transporter ATP-binding protein EcfA2
LQFGNESYANLKVTTRGLVSSLMIPGVVWLHGCALTIDVEGERRSVMLIGRSGAGKTTLTAALRARLPGAVKIVNDDWGALSLLSGTITYTGEQRLHMKYMSVAALRPDLEPTPATHQSEEFRGDRYDPLPRLLISPTEVFGSDGVVESAALSRVFLVKRGKDVLPGIRSLSQTDALSEFERGEYSEYYTGPERFFNGSLFLHDDGLVQKARTLHAALFERFPPVSIGNTEHIDATAASVLEAALIEGHNKLRR